MQTLNEAHADTIDLLKAKFSKDREAYFGTEYPSSFSLNSFADGWLRSLFERVLEGDVSCPPGK